MDELVDIVDYDTDEPVVEKASALPGFCYQNGYLLSVSDLGKQGIKIELLHKNDAAAIILPPEEAKHYAYWLLNTISLRDHSLPRELPDILRRLLKYKYLSRALKHGDKKKIKDAIRFLKRSPSQN